MCRENIFQLPVFFLTDFNKLVTVPDDHSQSNNIANDGRGIQGDGSCLLIKEWITTQRTTKLPNKVLGIEEQYFNCRSSVSRQICDKLDSFPDDCPNYNHVPKCDSQKTSQSRVLFSIPKGVRDSVSRKQTFSRLPSISGQIFENWTVYPTINYTQSKMQLIENRTTERRIFLLFKQKCIFLGTERVCD